MKRIVALAVSDIKITARRGEALMLNIVIPLGTLIAMSKAGSGVQEAVPFAYLLIVLATSLASLGITTGFDRRYRVLVRLGTTPLGKRGLIFSKILSLIVIQTFQMGIISIAAVILGWKPTLAWLAALPVCWIASCAFAGIALFIAGRVKAEANLGLQNLVYLIMIGFGSLGIHGMDNLPEWLQRTTHIIPSGALFSVLRSLAGLDPYSPLAICSLVVAAIVLPVIAARRFTFDE